jgi:hypothetical protein
MSIPDIPAVFTKWSDSGHPGLELELNLAEAATERLSKGGGGMEKRAAIQKAASRESNFVTPFHDAMARKRVK